MQLLLASLFKTQIYVSILLIISSLFNTFCYNYCDLNKVYLKCEKESSV